MPYAFIVRLRRAAGWPVDSRPFAFADTSSKEAEGFEAAALGLGLGLFLIHILDFRPSCSLVIVRHTYT